MSDFNKKVIEEFRANEGKVGGHFEGANLLILHTIGAKSGKERVNPLMYLPDDHRYVIIASKAGAPSNPDWYYNDVANPDVTIEVGTEELQAQASVADEPERSELYERMVAVAPGFDEYRQKTDRTIPVVILEPKS